MPKKIIKLLIPKYNLKHNKLQRKRNNISVAHGKVKFSKFYFSIVFPSFLIFLCLYFYGVRLCVVHTQILLISADV